MVKLERKAIKIDPENPRAKLSALIVRIKISIFGPILSSNRKNRFVNANKILLMIKGLDIPYRTTESPPINVPKTVTAKPNTFVMVAMSLKLKPISI